MSRWFKTPYWSCCFLFCSWLSAEEPSADFNFPLIQTDSFSSLQEWKKTSRETRFKKREKSFSKTFIRTDKNNVLHGHVQDPNLEWEWGLRNGVRVDTLKEGWHVAGTYTHFHSKSFASARQGGQLFPLWEEIGSPKVQGISNLASSSWRLDVDIADLEVGKMFSLNETFSMRPHIGVRSTWMYQKFEIDYENDFTGGVNKEPIAWNNCLAFGTRGGVDTLYCVTKRFKIFGDGAISWLSGYHNIHERQSLIQVKSSLEELNPAMGFALAEFSLGLQYEKVLERKGTAFMVRLGYEFNYFLNQSVLTDWFAPFAQGGLEKMISLEGLSLGFHLNF